MKTNEYKISLEAARINAGYNQSQVAQAIGVDRNTICRWEKGKTQPKADQFQKLVKLYDVPINMIAI